MYLKGIELTGFKSFAKKSSLDFGAPISAIVGPNGSGKSNVAEAFRFVLGEQSIKSLRGKKGEDLIFNGAGDSPRANRAGVKVTFDNRKKFFNIDFDEVSIERVVHRDGINEYLINGSQVRLRDVIELLAGAHIGASGHHIISQGEADRILNSNLRERRAMLEDALGLKIYQYKRQESERKLEKTLENIKSVDALRKEIAPHLRFLKKQVEKVEKAVELKDQLKTLGQEYLKRESIYIENNKKEIISQKRPLEEKKKKLEEELSVAKAILESSKNKDAKSQEIIDLETKIQSVRSQKDSLIEELGKIQGEISSEERILKKQKEIITSNEGKTVYLRDVEDLAKNIDISVSEAEKSEDLSFIKKTLSALRSTLRDFIGSKKEETNDSLVRESEEAIARLSSKKNEIDSKLKVVKSEEENSQKNYRTIQKDIEKEKDSNRDAEKALFRIMSEQNLLVGELNQLRSQEENLTHTELDFKRELEECAVLAGREILDYGVFVVVGHDIDRITQEERRRAIEKIKIRLEDSGMSGSAEIVKEFQEVSERDTFLSRELEDLDKSAISLKQLILELGEKLDIEFKTGIEKINKQFQNLFELMFGGGNAHLSVVKEKKRIRKETDDLQLTTDNGLEGEMQEEDTEEEGIDIEVSLPRKKIKGLVMLSGGERALTSIALLFAISQVNPPPFIILDETDAALDEANSKKYGDMVENLAKSSQLILITHNRETMSRAGVIYGVTMGAGGTSKILSIQFEEAVSVAK
jgi:chromosome segregation protein